MALTRPRPTSGKFASDSLLLSSSATALLFKLSQKTNEEVWELDARSGFGGAPLQKSLHFFADNYSNYSYILLIL